MTEVADASGIFPSGGAPRPSVAPRDVDELAALLANATTSFRIRGAGHWLDAGQPVAAATTLDISALRGIVDYVPGDLTITAHAGTPLAELDAVVTAEGQWLALDPFGSRRGTLGATLATASYGPLGGSIGHPRDQALGLAVVDGSGNVQRAGGRVVKNVAGFDLVRLHVGAWGSLGVITEATVRLRAQPACDRTVAFDVPAGGGDLASLLTGLQVNPLPPVAAELLSAGTAAATGLSARERLLVRWVGSQRAVEAALGLVPSGHASEPVDPECWARLASADPPALAVVRYSTLPAMLPMLRERARRALDPDCFAHATTARGVLRVAAPASVHRALDAALDLPVRRVVERGPTPRTAQDAVDRLSRDLRRAFDPHRHLNPGIMGDDRE